MTQANTWNPDQYHKFRTERMQPFFDLVAMIQPRPGMRVLDLGCGTGELDAELAARLPDATVEGIDSSPEMLAKAAAHAGERVSFRRADIATFDHFGAYDLIFSHAAFQWVPENESLVRQIVLAMKPGAQLAVQMPQNDRHPSHALAHEVAATSPFRERLDGYVRQTYALPMERYAELLHEHGLVDAVCIEKIYGHEMAETGDVVEWVKGTLLTAYLSRLDAADQEAFLAAYRARLLERLGQHAPYFYPFRRLLFWAMKPADVGRDHRTEATTWPMG